MKTVIFCYSENGRKLAEDLKVKLGEATIKYKDHADLGTLFKESDALIFICATGIAVRLVAPYLESKTTDPAVIVIDDRGRNVIPLLSGHIGGANALAKEIAGKIDAAAVITTATDGAGKFACDTWAVTHGCAISSLEAAKEISAKILQKDVSIKSEFPLPEKLPYGLKATDSNADIYIGIKKEKATLNLIPKIVTVGIGCRKGTPKEQIKELISEQDIDERAIEKLASIDIKQDEPGLKELAEELNVPIVFYTAEELKAVPGDFTDSKFVEETTGVGNVCERAALKDSDKLILKKTAKDGVTVAAAIRDWRPEFE